MPTEFFEKHPTSLRLEMFTVPNEGFQRWDPAPKSADAKAFLVITAEDLSDGAFTTQIVGLSLNGLKDMGKNGIQHVAEPTAWLVERPGFCSQRSWILCGGAWMVPMARVCRSS